MILNAIFLLMFLIVAILLGEFFLWIVARSRQEEPAVQHDLGSKGFLGLFFIGYLGILINFFLPLGSVIAICILGIVITLSLVFAVINKIKISIWNIVYLVVFSLICSPIAYYMSPGYDGGLYHLPHQLWLRTEPLVIGLANFHGRLGFASLLEYIAAFFWLGEDFVILTYLQTSYLIFFLLFLINQAKFSRGVHLILIVLVVLNFSFFHPYIAFRYTSTDIPAGFSFVAAFLYGHRLLYEQSSPSCKEWILFLFLAISALFYKLTTFLLLFWVLFVVACKFIYKPGSWKVIRLAVWFSVAIILVFFIRNLLISGCLLYPSGWTCFNLPWSAEFKAIHHMNAVTSWAQHPNVKLYALGESAWLFDWWLPRYSKFLKDILIAGIMLATSSLILSLATKFKYIQILNVKFLSSLVFVSSALVCWFLVSPDPRFGIGALLLFFPIVFLFFYTKIATPPFLPQLAVVFLIIVSLQIGKPWSKSYLWNSHTLPGYMVVRPATKEFRATQQPVRKNQCWLVPQCSPEKRWRKSEIYGRTVFYPP